MMTTMNEERAGFEAVYGTIKPEDHATGDDQAIYELERMAFQAGAAWQRAQGAVPHPLRYTNDGEFAECPCCGSLDVGGAHDTVNCYGCGLQITKPRPLKNAADAWNKRAMLAAAPAHPAERQEQGEVQRLREALDAIATCTGDDQARDCAMAALAASTGQEVR